MINEFIDDIKQLIINELGITEVDDAYLTTETPKANSIKVQCNGFDEIRNTTTFNENLTYSVPVTIYCYNKQDLVNSKNAIQTTSALAERVFSLFDKNVIKVNNINVISVREKITPALPVKDGTQIYVCSVRLEFTIRSPYQKIY